MTGQISRRFNHDRGIGRDFTSDSTRDAETRRLLKAVSALERGDFSARLPLDWTGVAGRIASAFNQLAQRLERLTKELAKLHQLIGREGRIDRHFALSDAPDSWADAVNSVNSLVDDLVRPTREMARVIGAVARGDLSQSMALQADGRSLRGEFLQTARTVNGMVGQLKSFASEVSRVAREVGTDGKLGGQAKVKGVAGTWKDLTDNVNSMASNLTGQVRNIAAVTDAVAHGNLSRKITVDVRGEILELKNTINTMVDQLRSFAAEVSRVAWEVGTEGKLGGQAKVEGVAGTWKDLTDSVNSMASNLTSQVRNIATVTTAVARGDLSRKITVPVHGEILELKNTFNTLVDQLRSFASEVTRVAREVGTDGKLGGQARVPGVAGTWKDLTDNVNRMADNLTSQVRGVACVVTAVANGNLQQKLTVQARGETAALADTINAMIRTLATFADQVTSVAHSVGVEGRLGGQARVPGASGTWRDLTDNVNQLAANLTNQVRAIAEVATAVTKGDLTRSIKVRAQGEVAALKDNINEMIRNLRETTLKSGEQDWLKTNLAKFSQMLQGQRDLVVAGRLILSELVPVVSAQQAVFYLSDTAQNEPCLTLLASYASRGRLAQQVKLGEGLLGQCALEKTRIVLTGIPRSYFRVSSGLGTGSPLNIVVLPVLFEGHLKGVIELASLQAFSPTHLAFLDLLLESIGVVINTIQANKLTEELLQELLEISDREQRRIGQDLHDDLCQRLSGIEMMSQFLVQKLETHSSSEAATAAEITKLVRQSISHTRDLARGLSPVILESGGLTEALQELAANAEPLFKVSCEFKTDPSVRISDNKVATHLYRIAQEALTNAIKHGRSQHVVIRLTNRHDRVQLLIEDDGIGLPKTARKSGGMGLRIMQYRARMIGASLTVERRAGSGTKVACEFRNSFPESPPRRLL